MKRIYTSDNVVVLHSVKNVLALNGIDSFVKNEHTGPVGAWHGIGNSFHELWILNDLDFDKASAIIEKQVENPTPAQPWTCAMCGENNGGSFEVCWKCQSVPAGT